MVIEKVKGERLRVDAPAVTLWGDGQDSDSYFGFDGILMRNLVMALADDRVQSWAEFRSLVLIMNKCFNFRVTEVSVFTPKV